MLYEAEEKNLFLTTGRPKTNEEENFTQLLFLKLWSVTPVSRNPDVDETQTCTCNVKLPVLM